MTHNAAAVFIIGQCSSPSEAQWREITERLPEPRCNAQTISKLAEVSGVVIQELHDAIQADLDQPTRSKMANKLVAARESREFDDTDPNMLAVFELIFQIASAAIQSRREN